MAEVTSPCRDVCNVDVTGKWCLGCGRSLDEIAGWSSANDAERRAIIEQLPERLLQLKD